jgi:UDP-N-acetyl-L-fucosamine synthase
MNNQLKLMTIVGTRPEIIRLSATIKACNKYFNHILVHTGQNWDPQLSEIFFKELDLKQPDYSLNVVGDNLGETVGKIISESYKVLQKEMPDALLVLGDTNSALSAIAAKRLKIPIFHMEAGNRCFDQNVPEEINRKIVDHISDINLPYTEHSRKHLAFEGIKNESIFVTGSPMTEVIKSYRSQINSSSILNELNLEKNNYFIVSAHREENLDNEDNFLSIVTSLNEIANKYQMPIVYSTHPRTQKKIESKKIKFNPLIRILKPFGFFDYCSLQKNSFCVLSDSGTLSEEASILNFPGVLIRTSTERPEALDKGRIIIGSLNSIDIIHSVELATKILTDENKLESSLPHDYKDINVSIKVVKIIQSYTKIVNQFTWRKNRF